MRGDKNVRIVYKNVIFHGNEGRVSVPLRLVPFLLQVRQVRHRQAHPFRVHL